MTTKEGLCDQNPRIGCENSGTLYKMPFTYGTRTRLSPEFWCEECIANDPYLEIGEDDEVHTLDEDGNRIATTEECIEAYHEDHDKFEELMGWTQNE